MSAPSLAKLQDALSILGELMAVVQLRTVTAGGGRYWETIAAFNCAAPAIEYAKDCNRDSGQTYRACGLTGESWCQYGDEP